MINKIKDKDEEIKKIKDELGKELKIFTKIAEKCLNLFPLLMVIRNLTWEIRYGDLENRNLEREEYIKQSVKRIKEIQMKIDKEFNLDKEEYEYFYSDYKFMKEKYNFA